MKQIKIKQSSAEITLSQKGNSVKIEILELGQTSVDGEAFFKAVELLKQHWEESKYKTTVEVIDDCTDSRFLKQKSILGQVGGLGYGIARQPFTYC